MQKKNPYIYYFIDKYNIEELTNLEKNINLIFRNYKIGPKINEIKNIQKFCKISKRNLYLANNIKLALKLGLDGVDPTESFENVARTYLSNGRNQLFSISTSPLVNPLVGSDIQSLCSFRIKFIIVSRL